MFHQVITAIYINLLKYVFLVYSNYSDTVEPIKSSTRIARFKYSYN